VSCFLCQIGIFSFVERVTSCWPQCGPLSRNNSTHASVTCPNISRHALATCPNISVHTSATFLNVSGHTSATRQNVIIVIITITIINIKDCTLWSFPSPKLQLLTPTFLRSSNCSPSLWSVVVWFERDSVLWHSLEVLKPAPSVFVYLVQYACNL